MKWQLLFYSYLIIEMLTHLEKLFVLAFCIVLSQVYK